MKTQPVALAAVTVLVAGLLLGLPALPACSSAPDDQPCNAIPTGGCPLSHGVACDDPSCVAVYACELPNTWVLDHVCPPHEAGAPVPDASAEAAPLHDAAVDAPPGAFGGPGCDPLEAPDCTLGLALACPSGCCDCADLFVCQGGGWVLWGACSPDAGVTQSRP